MRDWTALELGLLRDIFFRLPADADAVSFRHVCRRWDAAACGDALVPRPWFISHPSPYGPPGASAFLRPVGHRRTRVKRVRKVAAGAAAKGETAASARPRGTSRGWIAFDDGKRLFLRDPVSGAEVPLPAFDPALQMFAVFLSDDPLASAGAWTAFAFFRKTDCSFLGHVLAFYRSGDAEWALLDPDNGHQPDEPTFFRGLEFFRGRAYVLLFNNKIAVCDVDARRLVVTSVTMDRHGGWDAQERLVECGGELLLVQVAWGGYERTRSPWWRCLGRRSYRDRFDVRVVKIELDADGGGAPVGWSDVEGIGDHAVFVATTGHVFALPASGFPAVRAGCVYHFNSYGNAQYAPQMIITDLRERPHRHEIVKKLPLDGHCHPLSWICPRRLVVDET